MMTDMHLAAVSRMGFDVKKLQAGAKPAKRSGKVRNGPSPQCPKCKHNLSGERCLNRMCSRFVLPSTLYSEAFMVVLNQRKRFLAGLFSVRGNVQYSITVPGHLGEPTDFHSTMTRMRIEELGYLHYGDLPKNPETGLEWIARMCKYTGWEMQIEDAMLGQQVLEFNPGWQCCKCKGTLDNSDLCFVCGGAGRTFKPDVGELARKFFDRIKL